MLQRRIDPHSSRAAQRLKDEGIGKTEKPTGRHGSRWRILIERCRHRKMRVGVVHADHFALLGFQDVSEDDLATGVVYVQIVMTKRP